ncbi:hypothetical protein FNQ90_06200 [Streptomyces alkaliphilus]|uniref:Uncharacterized protein n=1 Tax=Streptomyces alkaliphilus TaxID=1472722 RepID=A0A7W3TBG7_9ACTN|nr:hypothetical protein [Streptomyces alkaliphilus]MBB0243712.1 hypothetical protein [Streptomyces alkaliphilus]
MSTTRRMVLGTAAAAPLLSQFAGTTSAAAADDKWGTMSDGWIEVRWTPRAGEQLDRFEAVVEAVAPARLVSDAHGSAVRFPVPSGSGDPSLADLQKATIGGSVAGGIAVRTRQGSFRVEGMESLLRDGVASGTWVVNGIDMGHRSVFRCDPAEGRLSTEDVPPGRPMRVRIQEVPMRPTAELLEGFAATFGRPAFTADTVVAHFTAEALYTPPGG